MADRNYRILKVTHNARVEAVGRNVRWVRLPNADLVVSVWRRRVNVFLHLHGSLAAEEQWIRVRLRNGALYDVHRDDLSELLRRDPNAKIIPAHPAPGPWFFNLKKAL
jgi:hypothetical protein